MLAARPVRVVLKKHVFTFRNVRAQLAGARLHAAERPAACCALLPPAVPHSLTEAAHNPDERNSGIQVYVQLGEYTLRRRALQLLCHQVRLLAAGT